MDVRLWFDPVCPFCWMTSKWLRLAAPQRDLDDRVALHLAAAAQRARRLRRAVPARVRGRAHRGPADAPGRGAGAQGARPGGSRPAAGGVRAPRLRAGAGARHRGRARTQGSEAFVAAVLATAGLPATLAEALEDTAWDESRPGRDRRGARADRADVGTPILQVDPPDGLAFFGPVISRMPTEEQAGELWDHAVGLARFPGFAELKRSLREQPQLPSFGVATGRGRRRRGLARREPTPAPLRRDGLRPRGDSVAGTTQITHVAEAIAQYTDSW